MSSVKAGFYSLCKKCHSSFGLAAAPTFFHILPDTESVGLVEKSLPKKAVEESLTARLTAKDLFNERS